MNNFKKVAVLAATGFAAVTGAQAATITTSSVTQLTGQVNNFSTVFRYDLSSLGLSSLTGVNIIDSGNLGGTTGGKGTGLDIDAILISSVYCDTAACAQGLTSSAAFDFANAGFTAGTILSDTSLFGVNSDGSINHAFANLGAFDATTATMSGWMSFGLNGSLTLDLMTTLALASGYYLYVGEAGQTGEFDAARLQFTGDQNVLATPIPGALPLMLTGLIGLGLSRRRKKAAAAA